MFGTGIGIANFMLLGLLCPDPAARVFAARMTVRADFPVHSACRDRTATELEAQARGAAFDEAACRRQFRRWFVLGWPAFGGLVVVFWLMVAKPTW
jgi:uncharacterized membrane protein